jgi:hypothetical protein
MFGEVRRRFLVHGSLLESRAAWDCPALVPGQIDNLRTENVGMGNIMDVRRSEETNLTVARLREMYQRTEATCLLGTGALYRKRIGLQPTRGHDGLFFAGFKHGAFSLYFGDAPIYHFDLEGRWQRAFLDGLHYLKGLDAEVHEVDRVRQGPNMVLRRRKLNFGEAADLDAQIRKVALDLLARLGDSRFRLVEPPEGKADPISSDELHEFLERISGWDAAAWFAHRERYTGTYGPLPFLPPECQNAVVLQATLGHAEGLTFGFSPAAEPYVRSIEEFAQHAREVAALWGARLQQSRLIFLAGDDVLHQSPEQVEAYLEIIGQIFAIGPADDETDIRFQGVHAFLDDFASIRLGREGWRRLAERGLNRVSLGVESGDPEVRALYGKHWDDEDLRTVVADVKEAGLGVSVLTLVGAGGVERADDHRERTAALIESLALGRGDFVFLLDEEEIRDPTVSPPGLTPLERPDWVEQQRRLKEGLASLKDRGIKVLPYTLEKQWT